MKKINLAIPKPCHEDWDKMTQEDKGRFCGSCQKTVIDFTNMSDRQLAEFFKKPVGSVCGRFQQDQLQREIAVPKKRIPWMKYFFQFALPAFLVSLKASAQKTPAIKGDTVVCRSTVVTVDMVVIPKAEQFKLKEIRGTIYDEHGNPIPFATVKLKGTDKVVTSDTKGNFRLPATKEKNKIIISAIGFEIMEVAATTEKIMSITLTAAVMGGFKFAQGPSWAKWPCLARKWLHKNKLQVWFTMKKGCPLLLQQ